jgi:hypothetical protein
LLAELVVDETAWVCRRSAHSVRRLRAGVFGFEVSNGVDYQRLHHTVAAGRLENVEALVLAAAVIHNSGQVVPGMLG